MGGGKRPREQSEPACPRAPTPAERPLTADADEGERTGVEAGGAVSAFVQAAPVAAAGNAAASVKTRAPAALAWMRAAVSIDNARETALEDVPDAQLDPRLKAALRRGHMVTLFPVQSALWELLHSAHRQAHDVCVSAPTGSGKTLAYALPIVAALSVRVIPRLRALVVLPTHDLAEQVRRERAGLHAGSRRSKPMSATLPTGTGCLRLQAAV